MKKTHTALLGAAYGTSAAISNTLYVAPFVIGTATVGSKIATGKWNIGKIAKTAGIVAGGYIAATAITGAIVGAATTGVVNEFIDEFSNDETVESEAEVVE